MAAAAGCLLWRRKNVHRGVWVSPPGGKETGAVAVAMLSKTRSQQLAW